MNKIQLDYLHSNNPSVAFADGQNPEDNQKQISIIENIEESDRLERVVSQTMDNFKPNSYNQNTMLVDKFNKLNEKVY